MREHLSLTFQLHGTEFAWRNKPLQRTPSFEVNSMFVFARRVSYFIRLLNEYHAINSSPTLFSDIRIQFCFPRTGNSIEK